MKKKSYYIYGFLGFFLFSALNITLSILIYSKISELKVFLIVIIMFFVLIFNALIGITIDLIRRNIIVDKPLDEILEATKKMSKGDFNIELNINHSYHHQTAFDLIKNDLNVMAKELSKSEILKNDFISNVSHEIKTPLSVINNYAQILKNKDLSEFEREKYVNQLIDATKKINNLVTNILKLNKLENQRLMLDFKKFNLSNLLVEQILLFEDLIEEKSIELDLNIEEDVFIVNEADYLEIVFNNLISNAIKFTDKFGKISISLIKLNSDYIIKFADSGCGMSAETGKHIFEKFYQGDTSHSKEGNGLGLALVKKVIDLIGGSISVNSQLGKGTTFTIIIKEHR